MPKNSIKRQTVSPTAVNLLYPLAITSAIFGFSSNVFASHKTYGRSLFLAGHIRDTLCLVPRESPRIKAWKITRNPNLNPQWLKNPWSPADTSPADHSQDTLRMVRYLLSNASMITVIPFPGFGSNALGLLRDTPTLSLILSSANTSLPYLHEAVILASSDPPVLFKSIVISRVTQDASCCLWPSKVTATAGSEIRLASGGTISLDGSLISGARDLSGPVSLLQTVPAAPVTATNLIKEYLGTLYGSLNDVLHMSDGTPRFTNPVSDSYKTADLGDTTVSTAATAPTTIYAIGVVTSESGPALTKETVFAMPLAGLLGRVNTDAVDRKSMLSVSNEDKLFLAPSGRLAVKDGTDRGRWESRPGSRMADSKCLLTLIGHGSSVSEDELTEHRAAILLEFPSSSAMLRAFWREGASRKGYSRYSESLMTDGLASSSPPSPLRRNHTPKSPWKLCVVSWSDAVGVFGLDRNRHHLMASMSHGGISLRSSRVAPQPQIRRARDERRTDAYRRLHDQENHPATDATPAALVCTGPTTRPIHPPTLFSGTCVVRNHGMMAGDTSGIDSPTREPRVSVPGSRRAQGLGISRRRQPARKLSQRAVEPAPTSVSRSGREVIRRPLLTCSDAPARDDLQPDRREPSSLRGPTAAAPLPAISSRGHPIAPEHREKAGASAEATAPGV
ncbi:hypothetical protein JHW43_005034 [Diplocarpon mali]|nr:hypothetical protein JHW43_005034 [Diplocarpon mali]